MFDNFAKKRKRICLIAYKMVNWQDDHAIGHVLTNHTFTLGMFLPISPFIYLLQFKFSDFKIHKTSIYSKERNILEFG